jgi:predicted NBD/HSP70 family sugar kinase
MAVTRRTSRDIRSESRLDVLHALLAAGEASRGDLAGVTGLSPATVATVVSDLLEGGIVTEARRTGGRIGRPTTTLRLNGSRGRVVGVDVAETYVRATVFDAALDELASVEIATDEHHVEPDDVIDAIARALDQALEGAHATRADVLGVGISLPGGMRRWTEVSVHVPVAAWHHVPRLRERIDLPIVVDNPLKAIATAELWFGEGRRHASMITVNLGTGSGCVEAYVGAAGIQETLAGIAPDHPLASEPMQREFIGALATALAPPSPDPAVTETLERTARYLGSAIADLVAVVDPEMITLTGWTAWALGDHLVPAVRRRVIEESPGAAAAGLAIEVSTVRGNSVATGIATIALERFLVDAGLVTTRVPTAL